MDWTSWLECDPFLLEGPGLFPDQHRGSRGAGRGGVGGGGGGGGGGVGSAVPLRFQVTGFVLRQTESHKGECPLECAGKFPDPEECCVTPSNCSLAGLVPEQRRLWERERERDSAVLRQETQEICVRISNGAMIKFLTSPFFDYRLSPFALFPLAQSHKLPSPQISSQWCFLICLLLPHTHTHTHTHTHLFPKTRVKPLQGTALFLCLPF